MENSKMRLTQEEVNERLSGDLSEETIHELYEFGWKIVENARDDIKHLDMKAGAFAAYSGAVITLLVSGFGLWSKYAGPWMFICVLASVLFMIAVACCSIYGLFLKDFQWFSQESWLDSEYFENIKTLKEYRIFSMCGVITSYRDAHDKKVGLLESAQKFLIIAMALLFLALYFGVLNVR
jgi:hypothetical protein